MVLFFSYPKELKASNDESFLIRRAYLDVLGIVPTIEEMDWYLVYNVDGYDKAVKWLLSQPNYNWEGVPKETAEKLLKSKEYKQLKKFPLTKQQINKNLLYVSGMANKPQTEENVKISKRIIVRNSLKAYNSTLDSIDYITNLLMSRSTNIIEANVLLKLYNKKSTQHSEEECMLIVLDELLELEDIKTK